MTVESLGPPEAIAVTAPKQEKSRGRRCAFPWVRQEGFYALLCCLIPLVCVLVAKPFAKAGFIDDWSYSHIALKLAQTGRFHYDNYASPMLVFQSFWGAAWIRVLGFSFDLLRFATLPFSLGFVLLTYLLGRKVGLRRDLALFGALTVGISPLFFPLAASFMTDPYGCFFSILCVYAAICSGESANTRRATAWVWVLAIAGILGGSDRQTVWVAPLALIPYIVWVRRADRRFLFHGLMAYAVCLVSFGVCLYCFKPPYAAFALSTRQTLDIIPHEFSWAVGRLVSFFLTCILFTLPALLCFVGLWQKLSAERIIGLLLLCTVAVVCLVLMLGPMGAAPFVGGLLTRFGILWRGQDALGFRPPLLPPALRIGLSVLLLFSGITFFLFHRQKDASLSPVAKGVMSIFCCAYVPLLLPGAFLGILYDRYALPIIPLLVVWVLYRFQFYFRRVPATAWACLIVFGAYSVIITHDYFSASRARIEAAQLLEKRAPKTNISGGFEYDGWTQLESTGNIEGVRYRDGFEWNSTDRFWFWNYAKDLRPEYVILVSRVTSADRELPSVAFANWSVPFRRFAIAQKREDLHRGKNCSSLNREPCPEAIP